MARALGWLCCSMGLVAGCASPLSLARQSFVEARYPEAVAQYRALSAALPELSQRQRFEYALYRGLSHLALGDAEPARRWLALAKRLQQQSPEVAGERERGKLASAWRSMGYMPGE